MVSFVLIKDPDVGGGPSSFETRQKRWKTVVIISEPSALNRRHPPKEWVHPKGKGDAPVTSHLRTNGRPDQKVVETL